MMLTIGFGAFVAQHFLLSAAARTLSLSAVLRMSDQEAEAAFVRIRWHATDGKPVCPRCGGQKGIQAHTCRRCRKLRRGGYNRSRSGGGKPVQPDHGSFARLAQER